MPKKDHCELCGLPFEAAISALPVLTGAVAGTIAGCAGDDCPPGVRLLRGVLAAGLTAVGTAGIEALATRVCQCSKGACA